MNREPCSSASVPAESPEQQVLIQLVSQFGQPVRGVSPYADGLVAALRRTTEVEIEAVDFNSAYPGFLHPAQRGGTSARGELNWYSPASWLAVATRPAGIMHIQHWAPPLASYLWPMASMARRRGRPVVVTVHNPVAHERASVFDAIEKRLLRSADMLLVHGEVGRSMLLKRFGSQGPPVRCIAHGMEVMDRPATVSAADYARVGLDPAHRYVLLFGNLRGYKGVDVLLDAWQRVRPRVGNARLVIAGRLWNGSGRLLGRASAKFIGAEADARRLQRVLADRKSMQGVVLREGFQDDLDIDALIRICEFAVFPYLRFSGQSGAASRAAAFGRPLLVSRVGGLPDLAIDDGWVFEPGDSEALALRLIEKLLPSEGTAMAAALQLDKVRRFDWSAVARDHLAAYRELA